MALIFNGTTIPTNGTVNFNGNTNINTVIFNGTTVWQKIAGTSWTTATTIPGTAALPVGTTITVTYPSGASIGYPSQNPTFSSFTTSTKSITKGSTVSFPCSFSFNPVPGHPSNPINTVSATMTITWAAGSGVAATASYTGWSVTGHNTSEPSGLPAFNTVTKTWK